MRIDSGTLWLGEPDRVDDGFDWQTFCHETLASPSSKAVPFLGGFAIQGFGGDGVYPVTVDADDEGLVKSVTVHFCDQEVRRG